MASSLTPLLNRLPQQGQLTWIGLRPERGQPPQSVSEAQIHLEQGLVGDHFRGRPGSLRQITLVQQEHLSVVAALLGQASLDPALLRRNLVVRGINLLALKDQRFAIGEVILEGTRPCAPCSKMETALGPGGFNALRGHGGLCARVVQPGWIRVGDPVRLWLEAQ
ncbi:MOSC domain-containing protein [Ferrimonas balearica]|uniref:MOSC domain-containing protein n=1 Tax=Ferrimonas balearica TaxID=44012 RepID=UPI001C99F574|nr:MOSC domain-containing protein [Ferrimonas balearica]MBY5991886.1 MOSC domain-containing protein [Ferrimonas balearica]